MKNYQSTIEGTWTELLSVQLTQEQIDLLKSTNEEDSVAKQELISLINSQRNGEVGEEKTTELNSFYNSIKPELQEEDVYQLISVDLSQIVKVPFTGILNCRVNGEHKQIRF